MLLEKWLAITSQSKDVTKSSTPTPTPPIEPPPPLEQNGTDEKAVPVKEEPSLALDALSEPITPYEPAPNADIVCTHGKLDPRKYALMKRISSVSRLGGRAKVQF